MILLHLIPLQSAKLNEAKDTTSPSLAHYLQVNQPTTHCRRTWVSRELSEAQLCIRYHHPHGYDTAQVLWAASGLSQPFIFEGSQEYLSFQCPWVFGLASSHSFPAFKKETGNAIYAAITFSIIGASFSFSLNHISS